MAFEVEPNLVGGVPGPKLYDDFSATLGAADEISVEQRALVLALLHAHAPIWERFADRIISALIQREAWERFTINVNDGPTRVRLSDIVEAAPGQWKVAGVLAMAGAANAALVGITIEGLVPGVPLRFNAPLVDASEKSINTPAPIEGTLLLTPNGNAGDIAVVYLRLQRYGG